MPQKILQKKKLSSLLFNSNINTSKSNYGDALFVNRKNQNASSLLIGKLKDSDSDGYADINDCNPNNSKKHGIILKNTYVKKSGGLVSTGGNSGTTTTTTSGTSSSSINQRNTYDTATGTYTDQAGNKMSMAQAPEGATTYNSSITNQLSGGGTSGGGHGGGFSYVDTKTGKGYEVSPTGIKTEVTPTKATSGVNMYSSISKTTGGGTYNPSTGTYTSSTGQKQSMDISNVPKNTAYVTSTGKIDKSFDKFGRPIEYYNYTQQEIAKAKTQKEYDTKVEKVVNDQLKYYQQLVNENKISINEANKSLNKVISVYEKDLSEGMTTKLQNKITLIQKGYETERVKKGVPLIEEQQYGTQVSKNNRTGSYFGLGSNNLISASNGFITGSSVRMDSGSSNRNTNSSIFSRFANSFKKDYKETTETYSPTLGAFISASPTGQGSTGFIRQPTTEEKYKIEESQYKGELTGSAIFGLPAQVAGGIFTKQLSEEEASSISTIGTYFNPKKQYEVFKSEFDYKQAVKKANEINNKLTEIDKQYTEGKIDYGEYEVKFNYYSQDKDYQRVLSEQGDRGTIYKSISESNLSQGKKNLLTGVVGVTDFLTFANPTVRVVRGAESVYTGLESYGQAQTSKEKIGAGIQIGVGGLLVGSGMGGGTSMFGGLKGAGGKAVQTLAKAESRFGIEKGIGERLIKFGESRTGRITGKVISEVPSVGISGMYGYGVYKETGNIGMGISAGLGGYGGIKIPEATTQFIKGKPLTQSEVIKLENELKQLEESQLLDTQVVYKGKGSKENSDKVQIVSIQETPNFKREIKVTGDLIRTDKGTFLFPEGSGISTTTGKFSIPKQQGRLYSNVQSFDVGAKGKGILLKQIGDIQISTQVGSSTYIPKESITRVMNEPRNWFENAKESLRMKLQQPTIQRGGQIVKSYETDRTPRTMSLNRDYELNENILLKSFGVSTSRGRKGTFFEYAEKPKQDVNIIKTQLEPSRKTPFSKTFGSGEPVSQPVDLISPKVTQVQVKPEQVKVETPKDFSLISKSVSRETGKVSKGELAELSKIKVTPRISSLLFSGEVSQGKQREELKGKELQKERFNFSNLISPTIKEKGKEKQIFITPQLISQRLNQQEIQKQVQRQGQVVTPNIIKPITPKPPTPVPPFGFIREKTSTSKEQPYNVMVRRDATKFNKARWEQVNRQPLTRESAMSMGARDVDETISARYKITKAKEIVQQVRDKVGNLINRKIQPQAVDTKDNYYKKNENKFRAFKQVRGKKISMPMTYIERQSFRADHPKEKEALKEGRENSVRGFFGI